MTSEKLIAIRREEPMMPLKLELNVPEEKIYECGHCKHLKHYLAFQGCYNTISTFKCKYLLGDGSCNHYEAIGFRDLLIEHEKEEEE